MEVNKKHIVFIIDNLRCGGKERRLVSLIKNMINYKNLKCSLILIDDDIFYKDILELQIKIYSLKRITKRDPSLFIKILKLIRKINPDIIHSWGSMPSIYSIPGILFSRAKFINAEIANAPLTLSFKQKLRKRISFPFSDLIVSNSLKGLKAYGVKNNKGRYVHNGFDFDRIESIESEFSVRSKYNITTKNIVGMVGAIYPKKDYVTYLLSAMEILNYRDDVTFLVVGDGEKLEQLKEMTKKYVKIIYCGAQSDAESIINIFDIGVLMTNADIHGEGISNSIMEYMALSKPVIATDCGANDEIIRDNYSGYLIPSRDANSLTEKVTYLLDNPVVAKTMGNNGRKIIEIEFSIDKMVRRTIELYKEVIDIGKIISLRSIDYRDIKRPTLNLKVNKQKIVT